MDFKKTYKEFNVLLPFSPDVKVQQAQREKMAIMSFLAGLPTEFETAKSQILSSSEISSFEDVFGRVLRTESTAFAPPLSQPNSLVSRSNVNEPGHSYSRNNNRGGSTINSDNQSQNLGGVVCYYCHEPGHTKRTCKKLQIRSQKPHSAYVAATNALPSSSSEKTIMVSAEKFVKFS